MPSSFTYDIDAVIEKLKVGIAGVESKGSGGYTAQNSQSTAAGKYQFLKEWLPDRNGKKGIISYAADLGYDVETLEDFKALPALQDAYFEYYAKEIIIPEAEAIIKKGNPQNLAIDQVAAVVHYQGGPAATRQVTTGNFKAATKKGVNGATEDNAGVLQYLKVYDNNLASANLQPTPRNQSLTPRDKDDIIKKFQKREEAINNLDTKQAQKEKLRRDLYFDLGKNQELDVINEYFEQQNKSGQEKFEKAKSDYNLLLDVAKKMDVSYDKAGKGKDRKVRDGLLLKDDFSLADQKRLRDMGVLSDLKKGYSLTYGGTIDLAKFKGQLEGNYKNVTGEDIVFNFDQPGEKAFDNVKDPSKPKMTFPGYDPISTGLNYVMDPAAAGYSIIKTFTPGSKTELAKLNIKEDFKPISQIYKPRTLIDKNEFAPKKDNITRIEDEAKNKEAEAAGKEVKEEKPEVKESTAAEDYYDQKLGLISASKPKNIEYGDTKQELPIDAVMGMALGLVGNEQAKNANIPLRTEQVSEAVKSYTADLARIHKSGMPVEEQAAIKAQLAEAYQGGLATLTNASNGNAALILGNQGQLEGAKNQGLVSAQVANFQAKQQAGEKYMQAIQYMNDFEARKDVANHSIMYQEGKEKQQAGRDLATGGFAQLMESIKYQRENGPGSANDMYRSLLMQETFGYDPNKKDDGSGTVTGTKSFFDKEKMIAENKEKGILSLRSRLQSLNPDQKKIVNSFYEENQDDEQAGNLMTYLEQNPNLQAKDVSMARVGEAVKQNNFGLLTANPVEAPAAAPQESLLPKLPTLEDTVNKEEAPVEANPLADSGLLKTPDTQDALMNEYYDNI